jgi:hypothetical protein
MMPAIETIRGLAFRLLNRPFAAIHAGVGPECGGI